MYDMYMYMYLVSCIYAHKLVSYAILNLHLELSKSNLSHNMPDCIIWFRFNIYLYFFESVVLNQLTAVKMYYSRASYRILTTYIYFYRVAFIFSLIQYKESLWTSYNTPYTLNLYCVDCRKLISPRSFKVFVCINVFTVHILYWLLMHLLKANLEFEYKIQMHIMRYEILSTLYANYNFSCSYFCNILNG